MEHFYEIFLRLDQQVLTESETANILVQVVKGLLYLKSQNILHRDMSLSNLLLTSEFRVKIADFGLATHISKPDEKHTTLCGTPNYISPEVASRAAHGLPVDVWGLGCMMYTLLIGKPPFGKRRHSQTSVRQWLIGFFVVLFQLSLLDTDGVKSTLTRVVMADYVVPGYLSIEAKDLLDRLLRKNPVERIHIDDVLGHPFMHKYMHVSEPKYNPNAIVSVDSGLMTMSSGMISAQNITAKMEHARSRSEDRFGQQLKATLSTPNPLFDKPLRHGFSSSSIYNRYDSQYSDNMLQQQSPPQQQPAQIQRYFSSDQLFDRNARMALMQQQQPQLEIPRFDLVMQRTAEGSASVDAIRDANKMSAGAAHDNKFYAASYDTVPKPQLLTGNSEKHSQKLSVPPLNSERLLPTRFKTKNAILSILAQGEVVVEMIKFRPKFNEDRVVDVCRISKDGLRIVVYQPDAGRYVSL